MIISIALLGFVLLAVWGVLRRYRKRQGEPRQLLFWLFLWGAVGVSVLFPDTTTLVARKLGVGRGLDLLLVVAVVGLFYLQFKVIARLERLQSELTRIVREIAIRSERE